jgi:hypothetical protein
VAHVRSLASATMPATASTCSLIFTILTDLRSPSMPQELGWVRTSRVAPPSSLLGAQSRPPPRSEQRHQGISLPLYFGGSG